MDPLCLEASTFAQPVYFRVGLALKALLALLSVVSSMVFLRTKKLKWVPSPTTKFLFLIHMFWAIEVSAGFFVVYVFDFIRFSVPSDDPCNYVLPARIGLPLRAIPGIGATFQTVTMFVFAIERLIATIWPVFFEKLTKNHLGVFLTASSTILNGSAWIYLVLFTADWNDRQILSTVTTNGNREPIEWLRRFYLLLELVTVVLFAITLFCNNLAPRLYQDSNLSVKYQHSENKKVIVALLPCFQTHFFLSVLQFGCFVLFPLVVPDRNRFSTAVWVELVFFQSYLYGLFMPLIIAMKLKRQKKSIVNGHLSMDDHFAQMNSYFEKTYEKLKKKGP